MTSYAFSITSEDGDSVVSVSVGSLSLVSYAAKEASDFLTEDETYAVSFVQFGETDGDSDKTLVALTADADTVNTVVSARLRKLRKLAKDAAAPVEPTE